MQDNMQAKSKTLALRLDSEDVQQLERWAQDMDRSVSWLIRHMMREAIARRRKDEETRAES